VEVGLVQINMEPTWSASALEDGSPRYALLPYSVALLQAYAEKNADGGHTFRVPVYGRQPVEDAVRQLEGCDLVGFSLYVWNERISLEVARRLKERSPETTLVFGGPQVPDRAEEWLRRNPFVDLACHGEGELTFTAILDGADPATLDGVSRLDDGMFVHTPKAPRLSDYSALPSPYLDGTFEPLLSAHPELSWIAMWETNRGCPFSCTFCDWGSATQSKVYRFEFERLQQEIEWFAEKRVEIVYCADGNFGILARDVEIAETIAASKQATGFPAYFYVNSTKNATERLYTIQKILAEQMGTNGVTMALQSVDPETLTKIKRQNISLGHFEELQRRFTQDHVYTNTDIIIGLPGETYESFADGVSHIVASGQHNEAQFRNCYVLPNAELADPAYREEHGLELVSQEIREAHVQIERVDEVPEFIDVVIGTAAMPRADWVRAKTFAWLTDALYFDRLLQVPFLLLGSEAGVPLRHLVDLFAKAEGPVIAPLVAELRAKAESIQKGGLEWFEGEDAGGILWPADQWFLLSLVRDGNLDAFYDEAGELLRVFEDHELMVNDALELNRSLFNTPSDGGDVDVTCWHTVWERYISVIYDQGRPLESKLTRYVVDGDTYARRTLQDWYQHIVWCDWNDKRGYLRLLKTRARAKVAV
jgi:protein-tyrosine-phosphatase